MTCEVGAAGDAHGWALASEPLWQKRLTSHGGPFGGGWDGRLGIGSWAGGGFFRENG